MFQAVLSINGGVVQPSIFIGHGAFGFRGSLNETKRGGGLGLLAVMF